MFRRSNPDRPARPGWFLLGVAAILLLLLAGAQGYVSWAAQYGFIFQAKHAHLPSMLEALGLDTGAVIFALLGLAHARMGRPAPIERALNLACAAGSLAMNLLGANLGSPRSVAVYVLPAVLYASCSDRLIATAGHISGVPEKSMWRWVGTGALYVLRAVVAFPSTTAGLRRKLLEVTPLPGKPGKTVLALPNAVVQEPDPQPVPRTRPTRSERRAASAPQRPIEEILGMAEKIFSNELVIGKLPGHDEIQRRMNTTPERAGQIRGHLAALMMKPPEPSMPVSDDTDVIHPVLPRSYQELPVTPVSR